MVEIVQNGMLIIISSPSGAGKSTLARHLRAWDHSIDFSVSATTRTPRTGERDGVDYYFKSEADFLEMVHKGEMLEHARVFNNYYGSPLAPVETALIKGNDILFDVDWQGGQQIRASRLKDHVVSIFILPPSLNELQKRLEGRAQDSEAVVKARMSEALTEISHWNEYDYVIINDNLERACEDLCSIIRAERLKRTRRRGLFEFVDTFHTGN